MSIFTDIGNAITSRAQDESYLARTVTLAPMNGVILACNPVRACTLVDYARKCGRTDITVRVPTDGLFFDPKFGPQVIMDSWSVATWLCSFDLAINQIKNKLRTQVEETISELRIMETENVILRARIAEMADAIKKMKSQKTKVVVKKRAPRKKRGRK